MAARGSIAPLSSNEEVTLRRVALGITESSKLPQRDVVRLKKLALVDLDGQTLRLTALGQQRYNELPRAAPLAELKNQADYAGLLAKHIGDPGKR